MKDWLKNYFWWVYLGIIGFQFYMVSLSTLGIEFDTSVLFVFIILVILPAICLIIFMFYRKNLKNYLLMIAMFLFLFEGFILIISMFNIFEISDDYHVLELWVIIIALWMGLTYFRMFLKLSAFGAFQFFVSMYLALSFIGLFDKSWWTLIPLAAALVLFIYSENWFLLVSNIEIKDGDIPLSMKKNWAKMKFNTLWVSLVLYPTIIFSDLIKEDMFIKWMRIVYSKKGAISSWEIFFFKGTVRMFIFGFILIIAVFSSSLFMKKSNRYKSHVSGYKKVIAKKERVIKKSRRSIR